MQQIRQHQVKGQLGDSLSDDIKKLYESMKTFNKPVNTVDDLPLDGNDDGDIRVVKSVNRVYIWNEASKKWNPDTDVYTQTLSKVLVIGVDGQTEINTNIPVGVVNGIISIDTIAFMVNGIEQRLNRDYTVKIDTNFLCVIEWSSKDFQLEISDTVTISYDVIKLS